MNSEFKPEADLLPLCLAAAKANRVQLALALLLVGLLWLNWGAELWRDADKLAILFGPEGNRAGFSY